MIPHKYPENPSLGTWVDTQRRRYRKYLAIQRKGGSDPQQQQQQENNSRNGGGAGGSSHKKNNGLVMTKDQVDRLLEIGFVFEPRLSREETWNRRVDELFRYKQLHGHCNVREDDTSNPGLGKWVSYIRRSHRLAKQGRRAKGKRLSDERIIQLKSIGFIFELKEEMTIQRYRDGIKQLREYFLTEGNFEVPTFYAPNPTFGLCVEDLRKQYRKFAAGKRSTLNQELVDELKGMGFLANEKLSFPCVGITVGGGTLRMKEEMKETYVVL
mmetsp:Transcript_741/g.1031  ORF Transcript_741/g.1031 Transcript_741/m.1031 type:complete len:269 (+) Transcript_741:1-807(+)